MIKKYSQIAIALMLTLILVQACGLRMRPPERPIDPVAVVTEEETAPTVVPTKRVTSPTPQPTQIPSTPTALAKVTVTAIKGNLYIRRGPDLAYNAIGVLYESVKAEAVARDVLSKWIQIEIPNSEDLGWVSLQTRFSQVQGDLQSLPEFTPTDWPIPAYLRNCTYHQMVVQPGDIILPSRFEYPENEIWIYPGSYTIYDLDHPDTPEVDQVEIREGISIDIGVDGNGEKRKCP